MPSNSRQVIYGGRVVVDFEHVPYHRYLVSVDGADRALWVSASTVARRADTSTDGLCRWAAGLAANYAIDEAENIMSGGAAIPPPVRNKIVGTATLAWKNSMDEASAQGTALHEVLEQHISHALGLGPVVDIEKLSTNDAHAYTLFVGVERDLSIEWLASERILADLDTCTVGTADALALVDGCPTVVDFKRTNDVRTAHKVQVIGGYAQMAAKEFGVGLDDVDVVLLRLPKDLYADHEVWRLSTRRVKRQRATGKPWGAYYRDLFNACRMTHYCDKGV